MNKRNRIDDDDHMKIGVFPFDQASHHGGDDDNEHVFDVEKAYRAMAMFVCSVEVPPLSMKTFVRMVNPEFHAIFRFSKLEQNCLEVYKEDKESIKQIFRNLGGQISLSIDMVRIDTYNFCNCLRLTARFIDDNWKLKKWVLHFRPFADTIEYTPENAILSCLSELDIEGKISTLTLVDDDEFDESVDIIRNRINERKKLPLNGQLFRVHCCADVFRSMVEDAFEKIDRVISKIRLIVSRGKSLPLWHITLHNLQEAIELKSKGEFVNNKDDYEGFAIPSAREWDKVRGVCTLVGSIYNAAEVFYETKDPSPSLYLHNLQELRACLMKESMSSYNFVRDMARNMMKKFEKYWNDMHLLLSIATVMDPRCKMKYIEFSSLKYEGTSGNSKTAVILEAIHELYDGYVTHGEGEYPMSEPSDSESEEDLPKAIMERRQKPDFGFPCLDEYNQFLRANSMPRKSDLDLYLEDAVLPWSMNFSLMSWWRATSHKYPVLSKMASDLLAIPFSSVGDFDAYYTEVIPRYEELARLKPDLVNALMCTRSWCEHRRPVQQ